MSRSRLSRLCVLSAAWNPPRLLFSRVAEAWRETRPVQGRPQARTGHRAASMRTRRASWLPRQPMAGVARRVVADVAGDADVLSVGGHTGVGVTPGATR